MTDADTLPVFSVRTENIPLTRLFVDRTYQRDAIPSWISTLVKTWSWSKFMPLMVSPRPDNLFAIIDGQQRWEAAKKLELLRIPCVVVVCESPGDEAELYVAANAGRNVGPLDRFKARLAREEPDAMEIARITESWGFLIGETGGSHLSTRAIRSVAALELLYLRGQLSHVLGFLHATWGADETTLITQGEVLTASGLVLAHAAKHGVELDGLSKKLGMDPLQILLRRARTQQDIGISSSRIVAIANVMVAAYNSGRRTRKIPGYGQ